jgi:hypothetical protein
MKEVNMKYYNDGAEFLDDTLGDQLPKDLDRDEFYDHIYHKVDKVGSLFYGKIGRSYDLLDVGSTEGQYLVSNEKELYEWYVSWQAIIKIDGLDRYME